jgi:hypothetical protein
MQVPWRYELENLYRNLVRDAVQKVWATEKVPVDYTRPRQDIDRLTGSVVWLHPRAPVVSATGTSTARAEFYIPRNLRLIHACDFVLSCIYPPYQSIDSAHEIGVAYACSKPVITVDLTHGLRDYAAWRAMSLVVLDSLDAAADFLLYQVQEFDVRQQTDELVAMQLNQMPVGDKLNEEAREEVYMHKT